MHYTLIFTLLCMRLQPLQTNVVSPTHIVFKECIRNFSYNVHEEIERSDETVNL